ncbi:uncharacterized protein LOC144330988 [Macaca mulatta]
MRPRPSPPASADWKDREAGTPGRQRRPGAGSGLPPALQCGSGSPGGARVWVHDAGAPGGHLTLKSGRCVERPGWRISSRFGTAHCTKMEWEWAPAHGPGDLTFAFERAGRRGCCRLGRCGRRPARRERLRDARTIVSLRPGTDIRMPRALSQQRSLPRPSALGGRPWWQRQAPPRSPPLSAPGKCSGVSVLVKGSQHQRSSCRAGFSEKEKVMQQRLGLEKLGE